MNFTKSKSFKSLALAAGVLLASVGGVMTTSCSDGYELGDKNPSWLGSSIYEYLKSDGHYTNTVRLIDDLDYANVLAKTGSKTLFVADDAAYERFFKKNKWRVSSYDELTKAQKKMLLFGSMINNSCQVAYLSSSQGPTEGDCMRRLTAMSEFDSVPIVAPADMPDNPYWDYYRDNKKTIPLMMDATAPPMVHFIQAFIENQLFDQEDMNFLTRRTRIDGEADVNGVKMEEKDIRCSNGFVHKMAEVITPLQNMAELIRTTPDCQQWSKLLDRFCAPYYVGDYMTKEYNRLYGTDYDSVFQKCYFSDRSHNGQALVETPAKDPVNGKLKFDPGWNQFYSLTNSGIATNVALQEDMGVMLVPSDKALDEYWQNSALKKRYNTWDKVPDDVIEKLIGVNMLNSFDISVPSKFSSSVLNDANDDLGLRPELVDSVAIACNGAVYFTKQVFNPVAYVSVSFPALVNKDKFGVMYLAIEQNQYEVYLNSQNSRYSFFLPTNEALLNYVDPCSYGKGQKEIIRFHYQPNAPTERERVWASRWLCDPETGEVTDSVPGTLSYDVIKDMLKDILDTHIVIGNVESGDTYYKTKGGSMVKVGGPFTEKAMKVAGSKLVQENTSTVIDERFPQLDPGNGVTYTLNEQPLMTTPKSVVDILGEHDEFSEFLNLLMGSNLVEDSHEIGKTVYACGSTNISVFNTFDYTVYVPTNEAIRKLTRVDKTLPTWEQVEKAIEEEDQERADSLTAVIEEFLKYHIQDNSVYIGMGSGSANYETASYLVDNKNVSYNKLDVKYNNDGITVTDQAGVEHKVLKDKGLYNLQAREYQYNSSSVTTASNIYTSSFAVVHQIDGTLDFHKKTKE